MKRDIWTDVEFEKGHYIIVPRTTGCRLEIPKDSLNKCKKYEKIGDKYYLTQQCNASVDEVYSRYDLNYDGLLNVKEINALGRRIGNKELEEFPREALENTNLRYDTRFSKEIREVNYFPTDFIDGVFQEGGITRKGLRQLVTNILNKDKEENKGEENFNKFFQSHGYNCNLNSTSFRTYMLSFTSEESLNIEEGDGLNKTSRSLSYMTRRVLQLEQYPSINHLAWSKMMEKYYIDGEFMNASEERESEDYEVFRVRHRYSQSVSYGVINKHSFNPNEGTIIPDRVLKMIFTIDKRERDEKTQKLSHPEMCTVYAGAGTFMYLGA